MDFEHLALFHLTSGAHRSAEDGLCAMEAVAWLEGLPHTDNPPCTCPVIGAYVRALNDRLPDRERQQLIGYLPRLVGTVSPEHELQRVQYLTSQSFGKAWPIVFRALGMERHALEFERIGEAYALAAFTDLAARAARAAFADLAARAADADLAAFADLAARTAAVARTDLAARTVDIVFADLAAGAAAASAARAAFADGASVYQVQFEMLDGVLAIGAQSPGFSAPIEPRISAYRALVE